MIWYNYCSLSSLCLDREVSVPEAAAFVLVLLQRLSLLIFVKVTRSKWHLVDLAGSERVHKTSATGQVYYMYLA